MMKLLSTRAIDILFLAFALWNFGICSANATESFFNNSSVFGQSAALSGQQDEVGDCWQIPMPITTQAECDARANTAFGLVSGQIPASTATVDDVAVLPALSFGAVDRIVTPENCPIDSTIAQDSDAANDSDEIPTKEELLALCKGEQDEPVGLRRGIDADVSDARDFIYSKSLRARNINNGYDVQPNASGGYSDDTCKNTSWGNARTALEENFDWTGAYDDPDNIPDPKHLSTQDYINYRCHVADLDCESKTEANLKQKYNDKRNALSASQQANVPSADEFFNEIEDNTKFLVEGEADEEDQVIQIPKDVTMAIMYTESAGDMSLKSFDDGYGLFQITGQSQKVEVNEDGVVTGESSSSNYNMNTSYHNENSVTHPKNNILKFTEIMQEKYLALRDEYTEDEYGFDFDDLSEKEKWQFVIASYNGGQGTVNKSLQRMNKFNQAQRCNSCGTLNANENGTCNEISTTCSEPVASACNKTIEFTYAASERFHNLGWQMDHDEDYNKYLKCIKTKTGFGGNAKGSCNVGVTFSYIRKVEGLKQCF